MLSSKTALIIDCDPGVDDAIALLLAFASPELEVVAITTVAGNVGPELTARNARMICQIAGRGDVPVYAGCTRPLLREPVEAGEFHGTTGIGSLPIFDPESALATEHAVAALIRLIHEHPAGSLTLVITGPMTNVALAMRQDPTIVERLGSVVIMGGARSEGGNITPTAEFNIFADPHAAAIVFAAGVRKTVFGLDVTHQIRATPARTTAVHTLQSESGRTAALLLDFANETELKEVGGVGTPMHDPSTIAWLLKPEIFELRPCTIDVETASTLTLGCTSVNFRLENPDSASCFWAVKADPDAFFELLTDRLR